MRRIVGMLGLVLLLLLTVVWVHGEDAKLEITPRGELMAPAGKGFALLCSGSSPSDTEDAFTDMKWFNPRDEDLTNARDVRVQMFGNSLKLTFDEPKFEDSGQYKCTALYLETRTLSAQANITFYEDIRFEDCEPVQNLIVGQPGAIRCRPIANPQPLVNWEKNKKRVPSSRYPIKDFGIEISEVTEEDRGLYTVEAFVKATGHNKYRNITVNVLTPPRIVELPKEFLVIEGEEYSIICRAEGSEPIKYTWFDPKSRDLSLEEGHRVVEGMLTIYRVGRDAGGEYTCQVENPAGRHEGVVRLEVQIRPRITEMKNISADEGKAAEMICKAEGQPIPYLSIRKDNGMTFEKDLDDRIIVNDMVKGELSIEIRNVKRTDDGLYYCKASNAAGDAETAGHLEVKFPPNMSMTPTKKVKAWSAKPANLSCIGEANPNSTITWIFQNEEVHENERYTIRHGISRSNLIVSTQDNSVYGMYTCVARNYLGEATINITLEEATVPGQLSQIVFHTVTSTTITFQLKGPGENNDGGLPITSYFMKYKLSGEPNEAFVTVNWLPATPKLLQGLKPRHTYTFSAAAVNAVGEGPYLSQDYKMPEEMAPQPPDFITNNESISEYPDKFLVRWRVPDDNGRPIERFEVRYFKVERHIDKWNQIDKAVEKTVLKWETNPAIELTGLSPDTWYKVEVRAVNDIGNSLPNDVTFRTRAGETTDGHTSMMDGNVITLPGIIAIVVVALFVTLVILDVTCFFRFHCGLLYLLRYRSCGRVPEKVQSNMEDGRACVKEVSTANNGKIKSDLKSPSSPDQLPPPDKLNYDKPKTEVDNPAFENRDARPADLIIDENFKNKSPKGSKTSIGKSSPV